VNGVKIFDNAISVSAPTGISGFEVGILNSYYASGYDLYDMVFYTRALSDQEVRDAYAVLYGSHIVGIPRTVIFEGSSITYRAEATPVTYLFGPNSNPDAFGSDVGTGGANIATLVARATTLDSVMAPTYPAQDYILSVEIGANDLGSGNSAAFLTSLAAYLDARRAAGWKVVAHTITPRTSQADGGVQFNIDRAAANTAIRTWVGVHCDALADWASDPVMGVDSASNNTTYYLDQVHPTTAGYTLLEPYDRAAINGIPSSASPPPVPVLQVSPYWDFP
jgi:hypothetical protein